MSDQIETTRTLDLCLRLGDVLMSNGAGAADVTVTMDSVARQFGLRHASIDVTFTSLSMSYQDFEDDFPRTLMRQVKHREIDHGDLTAVDHLVGTVLAGEVTVEEARRQLMQLASTANSRPRWAVSLGWGLMCGGVTVMLGGGPVVIATAFVAALLIDRVQLMLSRRRFHTFYQQAAGGAIAMLLATAVATLGISENLSLGVTANIIMLLSGVGFVGALQDALSSFYVTACARLLEVVLSTVGIVVGVSGGIAVAAVAGIDVGRIDPGQVDLRSLALLAGGGAVAAAAFTFASYAPWRALLPVGLAAGAATLLAGVLENFGFGRLWPVGLAAVAIGAFCYWASQKVRVPPLVLVVSAVVPLLPGLSIYRGLSLLADIEDGTGTEGVLTLVRAASVALALAAGVLLGERLAQPLAKEARRLESRLAGPRLVGPFRQRTRRDRG